MTLIELTIASLSEERPMFASVLVEPHFYRYYLKKWVKEGIDELKEIEKITGAQKGGGTPPPPLF